MYIYVCVSQFGSIQTTPYEITWFGMIPEMIPQDH